MKSFLSILESGVFKAKSNRFQNDRTECLYLLSIFDYLNSTKQLNDILNVNAKYSIDFKNVCDCLEKTNHYLICFSKSKNNRKIIEKFNDKPYVIVEIEIDDKYLNVFEGEFVTASSKMHFCSNEVRYDFSEIKNDIKRICIEEREFHEKLETYVAYVLFKLSPIYKLSKYTFEEEYRFYFSFLTFNDYIKKLKVKKKETLDIDISTFLNRHVKAIYLGNRTNEKLEMSLEKYGLESNIINEVGEDL